MSLEIKDVVEKLVGKIAPVGASHIEDERFENLKTMCALVNDLVYEIDQVANENESRQEHSMKLSGVYAREFLTKTLGIV